MRHSSPFGGTRHPDTPAIGTRFRTYPPEGIYTVARVVVTFTQDEAPVRFLVDAEDGSSWLLVSADPILDGIAYTGRRVPADR